MKNITFSANERVIEAARERARAEHTTLNDQFRDWLADYAGSQEQADRARTVIKELQGRVRVGRKLSREEMNER